METTPHFVLVPLLSHGHLIPMVDLARLLAERGVQVSLITTPGNSARIQGIVDSIKSSKLPVRFVEFAYPPPDLGLPPGCESADLIADNKYFLPFLEGLRILEEPLECYILAQCPLPSCIITDGCNPWVTGVARRTGIKCLVFHGMSCFYNVCDQTTLNHGLYDRITDRYEPFLVPDLPVRVEVNMATGPGFFNAPGWERLRDEAADAVSSSDGILLNTFEDLEGRFVECYEKALGRKRVWTLGPFCLYNKDVKAMASRGNTADVDEHRLLTWLHSKEQSSVIYVSFGSLTRKQLVQLVEIGHGLEASGYPFIWVIKKAEAAVKEAAEWLEEFEERNREKGLVVRGWAPQLAILAHRSVGGFMTHCGWNSMLEAISMGVPMVTWPHFADQFMNERLVVDLLGLSVSIGIKKPVQIIGEDVEVPVTRNDVEKAVSELMDGGEDGESRRAKAKEFGEKARKAMEKGGSSFVNLSQLMESFVQNG